jgi:hypothetical protein
MELPPRKRRDGFASDNERTRTRTGVASKKEKRWGCPESKAAGNHVPFD